MTQAEIATQPAWAVALEEFVGEIVGVAVLSVATGFTIDAFLISDVTVVTQVEAGEEALEVSLIAEASDGSMIAENVLTDSWYEDMAELRLPDILDAFAKIDPDIPMLVEVDNVEFADVFQDTRDPNIQRQKALNAAVKNAFNKFW